MGLIHASAASCDKLTAVTSLFMLVVLMMNVGYPDSMVSALHDVKLILVEVLIQTLVSTRTLFIFVL